MSKTLGERPVAETRRCVNCGCLLAVEYVTEWRQDASATNADGSRALDGAWWYTGEIRGYGYRSGGDFCTLECGYRYGVRCVLAGAQLERLDPRRVRK